MQWRYFAFSRFPHLLKRKTGDIAESLDQTVICQSQIFLVCLRGLCCDPIGSEGAVAISLETSSRITRCEGCDLIALLGRAGTRTGAALRFGLSASPDSPDAIQSVKTIDRNNDCSSTRAIGYSSHIAHPQYRTSSIECDQRPVVSRRAVASSVYTMRCTCFGTKRDGSAARRHTSEYHQTTKRGVVGGGAHEMARPEPPLFPAVTQAFQRYARRIFRPP